MATNNAINNSLPSPFTIGATSVTSTGTQLNLLNALTVVPFNKISTQIFTSSGTYTLTSGCKYIIIEGVGAGAGGGGAQAITVQSATGGGGGAGGYFRKIWTAAQVGATASITIGAAGTGGAGNAQNGTAGGDTTVVPTGTGSTLTGSGGNFGNGCGAQNSNGIPTGVNGGVGGTASGGDINIQGNDGDNPSILAFATGVAFSGSGGNSYFGQGGQFAIQSTAGTSPVSTAYGAGGSGGCSINTAQRAGGDGIQGIVIIIEFLSA